MNIQDSGPIYKETFLGNSCFAEPWNTWSNIFFLLTIIYWALKIYRNPEKQGFLIYALPILFVGFLGGSIYHGTRSSDIWLFMDWIPIALLMLSVSIFFAAKNRFSIYAILALVLLPFLASSLLWRSPDLPSSVKGLIGYPMLALVVLFPIFFYLARAHWKHFTWVLSSLFCFVFAISFRYIDNSDWDILPMGTHWLWHVFGALSSHLLIQYIFLSNRSLLQEKTKHK